MSECREILASLEGLDKANLAAHLCTARSSDGSCFDAVFESHKKIVIDDLMDRIHSIRKSSGFSFPDYQEISRVFSEMRMQHAEAAFAFVVGFENPGKLLTKAVRKFLNCGHDGVEQILEEVVEKYYKWSKPRLHEILLEINNQINEYRNSNKKEKFSVGNFIEIIGNWNDASQPVRLIEGAKGFEESMSRVFHFLVQVFCSDLATENKQYGDVLEILRALRGAVSGLPSIEQSLADSIEKYEALAAEYEALATETRKFVERLDRLVDDILMDNRHLRNALKGALVASRFGPRSFGLAKELYDAFSSATDKAADTELADRPWMAVRKVALDFSDEHDDLEEGCMILSGLMAHDQAPPSEAVVGKLSEDLLAIRKKMKWNDLRDEVGSKV